VDAASHRFEALEVARGRAFASLHWEFKMPDCGVIADSSQELE
jgi:hypothetical protein